MRRSASLALAASLVVACTAATSHAQPWTPLKPITIVVNVPPGSSTDVVARLFADRFPARLGQPVVVENRGGASGMIGANVVAKAAPDGHTLAVVPGSLFIAAHVLPRGGGTGLDVMRDLVPVVNAASSPLLILVNPQTGVRTPAEFVEYLRRNPGTAYGTSGNGSQMHVAGELLVRAARVQLTHVPYKGAGPAVADTVSGHIKVVIAPLGGIVQFISAGKLNAIALTEPRRSTLLPDVPTMSESGYPDVLVSAFYPLLAPAGTPGPILQRLNAEANAVLRDPDVRERLRAVGVEAIGGSVDDAARDVREWYDRFGRVVNELKISGD